MKNNHDFEKQLRSLRISWAISVVALLLSIIALLLTIVRFM